MLIRHRDLASQIKRIHVVKTIRPMALLNAGKRSRARGLFVAEIKSAGSGARTTFTVSVVADSL